MRDNNNDGFSKMLYAVIPVYMLTALEIKTRRSTGQRHQGWLPGVADTCAEFWDGVAFIHFTNIYWMTFKETRLHCEYTMGKKTDTNTAIMNS